MKARIILSIVLIIGLLIAGGVILKKNITAAPTREAAQDKKNNDETLYWTCAMHPSVHSEKPGKCPICGMELIPVSKPQEEARESAEEAYYGCGVKEEGCCPRCDEGKSDEQCICGAHSFIIKTDKNLNCPVCNKPLTRIKPADIEEQKIEGKNPVSRVKLNQRQIELAGIKSETIIKRRLSKIIRAAGSIAYDPGLAVAEEEFLAALKTIEKVKASPDPDVIERAGDLLDRSKTRLRLLGLSEEEIAALEKQSAPDEGLILPKEKMWAYAEIYEYELDWVKAGDEAKVTTDAYPGEEFNGRAVSISPVLDPKTRSARVRIEVGNSDLKLKPGMYVNVVIRNIYKTEAGDGMVLALPKDAVLDTGTRKIVYVQAKEGEFIGKEVELGSLASDEENGTSIQFYPVLNGLNEGDLVVAKGNFLIDSQSQLTTGTSLMWSGSEEMKSESETLPDTKPQAPEAEKKPTKHMH